MNAHQLLSVSVTPVVLISACGLITLALYNRLGIILARIRALHLQKIELLQSRDKNGQLDHRLLLVLIDSQVDKVTQKAKIVQKGLVSLLGACLSFLSCSFLAGAAVMDPAFGAIALVSQGVGLFLFALGVGWALRELMHSLTPLEEESDYLRALTQQYEPHVSEGTPVDFGKAA
jgi:hypothetical protein